MNAFLIVRVQDRRVGLPLDYLVEVLEPTPPLAVPSSEPALRGVIPVRGRLIPLVHLGALLAGGAVPAAPGEAAVVVQVGGLRFALEVDEAVTVARDAALPVPADAALPWAAGIVVLPDGHVPLLDLGAIASRLAETSA